MVGHGNGATRAERLVALYRTMLRIRAFEDAAEEASRGGVAVLGQQMHATPAHVRGPLHLSTGQEAVAAGVCANLERADYLTSTHRGHGHTHRQGRRPRAHDARAATAVTAGLCGGRGGSMHIADFGVGMLGANGVVAAGMPIAVGAAHSIRIRGAREIVACFFGDGAINRGPFGESLNWAQVWKLPVLFVCEDNRWSATTATGPLTAGEGAAARARAYGIDALAVDGNDVEAVDAAAAALAADVRSGAGPRLLHAVTYRVKGHVSVDPAAYRDPVAHQAAIADDPIARARERLVGARHRRGRARGDRARCARRDRRGDRRGAAALPPPSQRAYSDIQDCGAGRWRS